ncbi:class I SAM-dependent RNA methyltransferase [Boudabousia marimammalium]|uniref:TRAM domain-containing protein n=1 Tax=Boudabousia marimammalium TaxID=156892 RepID=A0A1Q5PR98_9ACTO|nr:class I SAM-dependent RNA methyltransferase [Boudabousia marimammalium]OKL49955.1 hypothetical protein BM477_03355 [Boudabousia marimammalium]
MSSRKRAGRKRKLSAQQSRVGTSFDPQPVSLRVERPAHGGACVGFHDGKAYFVKHAIPGETVVAKPYAAKGKVVFAEAIEITVPSSQRVPTIWPDAGPGGVGGGELCHVSAAGQRLWKAEVVRDNLRRIGGTGLAQEFASLLGESGDPAIVTQARQTQAWRTRCEFVIDEDGYPAMFVSESNELRRVHSFPLVTNDMQALDFWSEDSTWRELWRPGQRIRVIDCAEGVFVRIGKNWHSSEGKRLLLNEVHYRVDGKLFAADPNGFWQAHLEAPHMLREALKQATQEITYWGALELYSGAGLLTDVLLAESQLESLIAIEGSSQAVLHARENVTDAKVKHLSLSVTANEVEKQLVDMDLPGESLVVADPPRSGLGRGIAEVMRKCAVADVVLISCDPASFARDAALLRQNGYQAVHLQVLDIFPGTYHLEIVARFTAIDSSAK